MNTKPLVVPALAILLVGVSIAAISLYQKVAMLEQSSPSVKQQEVAAIVAKVGKLIVLPEGETPTVATVTDPEKLKDQAFFANAKSGDKVLIYANAKKAFLYDPVNDKLIDVTPLNIGTGTSTTTTKSGTL